MWCCWNRPTATAITAAITFYKTTRFWFNETRASTFLTVDGQSTYTSSDDADIPLWFSLDEVFLTDSSAERFRLRRADPTDMEIWLQDQRHHESMVDVSADPGKEPAGL